MARTKAEIRAFLDAQVGSIPQHPVPYQDLSGQCVTLIKVLMDFLGVPNPYQARGNAKDVDDTLLRQGIADNGSGWLTIVVNKDMGFIDGVHYGHIWVDLQNEANYESNGRQALHVTKNTRPITQGQQFVNLDKYVTEGYKMNRQQAEDLARRIGLLAHMSEKDATNADWVKYHSDRILADPAYAAALALQLYNGKVWQDYNWKGVLFDQEIKKRDDAYTELDHKYQDLVANPPSNGEFTPVASVDGKPTLFVQTPKK